MMKAVAKLMLVASVSLPAMAMAQNNEIQELPARRVLLDSNGVDLATGGLSVPVAAISAGDQSFVRYQQENGWRDGVGGRIVTNGSINGSTVSVMLGDRVEHFTISGSTYTPAEVTGSTLGFNGTIYSYTAGDGTYAEFNTYYADQGSSSSGSATPAARITLLRAPNGHQQTYRYGVWSYSFVPHPSVPPVTLRFNRLDAISSSNGYRTEFTYRMATASSYNDMPAWLDATSVKIFNTAVDSCPALTNGCTSAETRPSMSINAMAGSSTPGTYTDAAGGVTTATVSGSTLTIQAPGAPTRTYTLSSGQVSQASIAGVTTNYSYADSGNERTTVRTTSAGSETFKFYIPTSQIVEQTDVFGKKAIWAYNASRQLTSVTTPEGNYVSYGYDGRGNVNLTQYVGKGGSGTITASASYDATCSNFKTCNQPNSTTDTRGNVTDYSYDATHGGVLSVTAPAPTAGAPRPQMRYGYTLSNGVYRPTSVSACRTTSSCMGTSDEVKSSIVYDASGNVTSMTKGDGAGSLTATTTMTYDAVGNQLTVDGPLAGSADMVRTRYDVLRRPIGVVSPDPDGTGSLKHRAIRNTYTNNLLTKVERGTVNSQSDGDWAAFSALEAVETGYDAYGRPTTQTLKSGSTSYSLTQSSYDALGRVDCVAQRMNPAVYGSLPASACSLGTQGTSGPDRIVKNNYDAAGRVTKVQSAYGTTDQSDEVARTFTDNGKLATVTDAEGNRTTYEYDGFDRLSKTRYPSPTTDGVSSTTDYEQLGYDAASNVTSRRLRDGQTIGFTYDNLNRVSLKNLPGSEQDVTYGYDLLGRPISLVRPDISHTLSYDALGRLTSEAQPFGTVSYQYDLAGRRTRTTWPDSFYVTYDYNITGEVTAIRENGAASGIGVLATYGYDNLGRRTSITRGNGTVASYGYDAVSRLSSLTQDLGGTAYDFTHGFSYNPAGQIASATRSNDAYAWTGHYNVDRLYTVNGLNQMTAAGTTSLGYDGRGNLTTSGSSSYTYSSENLLKSAPGVTLYYDAVGRLHEYDTSVSTRFVYDGGNIAAEIANPSGSTLRRYVFGPGADEPLVWYEIGDTTPRRWLHADERGSIVAVTNDAGTAINVNKYDEYGIPGNTAGRFQYTGQAWLPELGMYYYKTRMYSPTLGRFMQTDPIGYGDGMNWYNYVGSDPVNSRDPSGMDCTQVNGSTLHNDSRGSAVELQCDDVVVTGHRFPVLPYTPPFAPPSYGGAYEGNYGVGTALGGLAEPLEPCPAGTSALLVTGSTAATGTAAASESTLASVAVATARALLSVLTLPLLLSGDTPKEEPQYVIRGGVTTPESLVRGTTSFSYYGLQMSGFSVTSAPGLSVGELAAAAQYPNGQISYTTTSQLAAIGAPVVATPLPGQPLHHTVTASSPLSPAKAAAISAQFKQMPNPAKCR